MGGFVETRDGEERPLNFQDLKRLPPETHPELLALIPSPTSKKQSHLPSPETGQVSEDLALTSLVASPPLADQAHQASPSSDPPYLNLSSISASFQYRVLLSEAAIRDKSKSNALAKLITVAQKTWFIIQFVERWAAHQPRTQLEAMTVAYAALSVVIYALWWSKPYNIDEPVNVSGRAHDCDRIRTIGILRRSLAKDAMKSLIAKSGGDGGMTASLMIIVVGGLFWRIALLGLVVPFPNRARKKTVEDLRCVLYCRACNGCDSWLSKRCPPCF